MSIRNDNPQFEIVEPSVHEVCGHAHHSFEACPPSRKSEDHCPGCGAEVALDCVCPE